MWREVGGGGRGSAVSILTLDTPLNADEIVKDNCFVVTGLHTMTSSHLPTCAARQGGGGGRGDEGGGVMRGRGEGCKIGWKIKGRVTA